MQKIFIILISFLWSMNVYAFDAKERTVQIIIPYGVGGGSDVIFNRIQHFAKLKGINMVPIYRPGVNGGIGSKIAHTSPPDGYTIGLVTFDAIGSYIVMSKTAVEPNNVLSIHKNIHGMVSLNGGGISSMKDLESKKDPVKIGYTTLSHRAILEYLESTNKFKSGIIYVPYKGTSEMLQNVISRDIDIGMTSLSVLAPFIKADKLHLLATDSKSSISDFPKSRRLTEPYYNVPEYNKGSALLLPSGTSEDIRSFWQVFVEEYLNNNLVKEDIKQTYSEETKRSITETDQALKFTVLFLEKAPKE